MTSTRTLVVDDDLGIRQTLEGVLTDEGHRVRTASTRAEALSSLRSHPADLVLLDLKMPDVTGFDLLCEIRSAAPETPIVMLTAYGTIKTAVDAIKLGASDFMTKPFNLEEVRRVIDGCCQSVDSDACRRLQSGRAPGAVPPTTVHVPAADDPIGSHTPLSERDVIIQALQECRWNQSLAAQKLGIHRNTLRMRMDRFGVSGSRPPARRR